MADSHQLHDQMRIVRLNNEQNPNFRPKNLIDGRLAIAPEYNPNNIKAYQRPQTPVTKPYHGMASVPKKTIAEI